MQPPQLYRNTQQQQHNSSPASIIPDPDPSLDENLLNMLTADGEEDCDPMLSPSATAKTLASLSQSNTALVLPNTVFSSKPVSNQDVGVFLQSSGKSSTTLTGQQASAPKQVILKHSQNGGLGKASQVGQFLLPQSGSGVTISSSGGAGVGRLVSVQAVTSNTTSAHTLRSLLSSTPENLPVSQTLVLSPLQLKQPGSTATTTILRTSASPSPNSYLGAGAGAGREESSSAVTLTLDDIMQCSGYSGAASGQAAGQTAVRPPGSTSTTHSDRESDLTSPGSVRSDVMGEDGAAGTGEDRLLCQFPGCGRSFDRPNLLKRHIKVHSGEASSSRFVCDVCKKSFESGSKLEDHYRRHTGERPFQCHVCGNKFRYKGDRTKHLKNLHGIHKSLESSPAASSSATTTTNGLAESESAATNETSPPVLLAGIREEAAASDTAMEVDTVAAPTKADPLGLMPSGGASLPPTVRLVRPGPGPRLVQARPLLSLPAGARAVPGLAAGPVPGLAARLPGHSTVTMSIEEVLQYAQPIADLPFPT